MLNKRESKKAGDVVHGRKNSGTEGRGIRDRKWREYARGSDQRDMREGEKDVQINGTKQRRKGKRAGKSKEEMTVIFLMVFNETFHSQTQISRKKKMI